MGTRRPRLFEAVDLFNAASAEMAEAPIGVEGHRKRLRERLLTAGPHALADHEMLEYVLFVLPRRDTKPLARARCCRASAVSRG